MTLKSKRFAGDRKLEAAANIDQPYITKDAGGAYVTRIQSALNAPDEAVSLGEALCHSIDKALKNIILTILFVLLSLSVSLAVSAQETSATLDETIGSLQKKLTASNETWNTERVKAMTDKSKIEFPPAEKCILKSRLTPITNAIHGSTAFSTTETWTIPLDSIDPPSVEAKYFEGRLVGFINNQQTADIHYDSWTVIFFTSGHENSIVRSVQPVQIGAEGDIKESGKSEDTTFDRGELAFDSEADAQRAAREIKHAIELCKK